MALATVSPTRCPHNGEIHSDRSPPATSSLAGRRHQRTQPLATTERGAIYPRARNPHQLIDSANHSTWIRQCSQLFSGTAPWFSTRGQGKTPV
ncbi:hypothetical protein FKM82_006610 [Ascaphus truei]